MTLPVLLIVKKNKFRRIIVSIPRLLNPKSSSVLWNAPHLMFVIKKIQGLNI